MGKRNIKTKRHHVRYAENIDFVDGILEPQISLSRDQLIAEIEYVYEIDDPVLQDIILKTFDSIIDDVKSAISYSDMSQKEIEKRFNKALNTFENKIKPEILRISHGIQQTMISAKHGGALEEGFKPTDEWSADISRMLSGDKDSVSFIRNSGTNLLIFTVFLFTIIMIPVYNPYKDLYEDDDFDSPSVDESSRPSSKIDSRMYINKFIDDVTEAYQTLSKKIEDYSQIESTHTERELAQV